MKKNKKSELAHYRAVIAANVRKLRGTMSQTEFAKKAGVATATVHRIESRMNFQADSLLRIAISFGAFPYELCLTEEERRQFTLRADFLVDSFKEIVKQEIIAELDKRGQK